MTKKAEEILHKLLLSPVKKYIFNEHYKVLAIQLVGSQLTELHTEDSDVDLIVICENSPLENEPSKISLQYQGIHIHWHYINYRSYFDYKDIFGIKSTYLHQLHWSTKESFVYIDPDFQQGIDFLLSNKSLYIIPCLRRFLYAQRTYLIRVCEEGFTNYNRGKIFYHFLYSYAILFSEALDLQYVKEIKAIYHKRPSIEADNYTLPRMQKLLSIIPSDEEMAQLQKEIDKCQQLLIETYQKESN